MCNYRGLYLLSISILIFFGHTTGQNTTNTDSIFELLRNIENPEQKIDTLLEISENYANTYPDQAVNFCNYAIKIAVETKNLDKENDALYLMSQLHRNQGQLDSGILVIEKYIYNGKSANDSLTLANGYLQMGNLLRRKGYTESAHEYYLQALQLYTTLNDFHGLISVSNALGIIFKEKSLFDSATLYYLQTMRLCEEHDMKSGICSILINLGKVNDMMQNYGLAKTYSLKSIPYCIKYKKTNLVGLAYNNLGIIEFNLKEYDSAIMYYDKAVAIYKQTKNTLDLNNVYINQGNLFIEKKEYRKAIEKFDLALDVFQEMGYSKGVATALYSKASALSKLGMQKQAVDLFDSSLVMAKKFGEMEIQQSIYGKIVDHYKDVGDYKKAFNNIVRYYQLKDSSISVTEQKNVADLTMKYEKDKDQAHILALTNENLEKDLQLRKRTNQRNIFIFSSIGIILLIIFLLFFLRVKAQNEKYINLQKIRQLEKDKKLISVQFLLEGQEEERKRIAKEMHDGIGVLLSTAKMQLSAITDENPKIEAKIKNATNLLEMATSDVRKITHNMMPGLLAKYGFFEALEDLVDQIDEVGTISTNLQVSGDNGRFAEKKEFMLYRIVQEMINNTLKHSGASQIDLTIVVANGILKLEYTDDGIGFNMEEKLKSNSLGLTSIQSRVNYLGGKITTDSRQGIGTKYNLEVRIN